MRVTPWPITPRPCVIKCLAQNLRRKLNAIEVDYEELPTDIVATGTSCTECLFYIDTACGVIGVFCWLRPALTRRRCVDRSRNLVATCLAIISVGA